MFLTAVGNVLKQFGPNICILLPLIVLQATVNFCGNSARVLQGVSEGECGHRPVPARWRPFT